ncbi:hypothetical protein PFISCL1PPCAC_760, partial [Pristionchus fissidentatus]
SLLSIGRTMIIIESTTATDDDVEMPDQMTYCTPNPIDRLHWAIVVIIITALLIALLMLSQKYAAVQYQVMVLMKMHRSRAKKEEEEIREIRKEMKGRSFGYRLNRYLDWKEKEIYGDSTKTARETAPNQQADDEEGL